MNYTVGVEKMNVIRREIADLRAQMRATQADIEPEAVADYAFKTPEGTARLSDLFGTHRDLIVIHNMGTSCPNCTLWADGYNGLHHHVVSRTGFVVSSPDSPEVQQKFASLALFRPAARGCRRLEGQIQLFIGGDGLCVPCALEPLR